MARAARLEAEKLEREAAMLDPYFEDVRAEFVRYRPDPDDAPKLSLKLCTKVKLVVDPDIHDSDRHYAGCRDDGLLIVVAPEALIDLSATEVYAVLAHEMGHAADFLYPARWLAVRNEPAIWLPEEHRDQARVRRLWEQRSADQVEFAADSIAQAVVGTPIRYGGKCMIQRFGRGKRRPDGLR